MSLAVHHSSKTAEHYTPRGILDAVERVFGGVPDLDPASNDHDAPNVVARRHFTETDNGLAQPWAGKVFLNPPYGRVIGDWIDKARGEWARGALDALIVLVAARPDTAWFETLTADPARVCLIRGRLRFVGNRDPAPFPSMVVYFGARPDAFADAFRPLGTLWRREPAPDRIS